MTDYEGVDLGELAAEYERVSQNGSGNNFNIEEYLAKFVKLPERDGFLLLRFLPRKKGTELCCKTRVHTLDNPAFKDKYGNPKKRTFHCPKELVLPTTPNGKPKYVGECIICKYYSDLWQKSEREVGEAQKSLQRQARAIKPVERYYYNVMVRILDKNGDIEGSDGPKIYSCGKKVYAMLCRAFVGDKTAGQKPLGDITHPLTGRDFRLVKKMAKSSEGEFANYDSSTFDDPSPAGSRDDLEKWLANLHDLQSLRVVKTQEDLRQALKVHLGMVVQNTVDLSDLEEFQNFSKTDVSHEPIREELAVTTTPTVNSSKEEETLADDDFMRELDSM